MSEFVDPIATSLEVYQPPISLLSLHEAVTKWREYVASGSRRTDLITAEINVAGSLAQVASCIVNPEICSSYLADEADSVIDEWDCITLANITAGFGLNESLDMSTMWAFHAAHASVIWQAKAFSWFIDPGDQIVRQFGNNTPDDFPKKQLFMRILSNSGRGAYMREGKMEYTPESSERIPVDFTLAAEDLSTQDIPYDLDKSKRVSLILPVRQGIAALQAGKALSSTVHPPETQAVLLSQLPRDIS